MTISFFMDIVRSAIQPCLPLKQSAARYGADNATRLVLLSPMQRSEPTPNHRQEYRNLNVGVIRQYAQPPTHSAIPAPSKATAARPQMRPGFAREAPRSSAGFRKAKMKSVAFEVLLAARKMAASTTILTGAIIRFRDPAATKCVSLCNRFLGMTCLPKNEFNRRNPSVDEGRP